MKVNLSQSHLNHFDVTTLYQQQPNCSKQTITFVIVNIHIGHSDPIFHSSDLWVCFQIYHQ